MVYITHRIVASVINGLLSPFDTHMVEKRIPRNHPIEFAHELLRYDHTRDPLHQFSAAFGKWIDTEFQGQIQQTLPKVKTENLCGDRISNQQWVKTTPGMPIT